MTISVLMSTYNGEKYLKEQLDSIINQKLPEDLQLKIVVRDDGSSDGTMDILEEYRKNYPDILSYYSDVNLRPEKSFWHLTTHCPQSDYYAYADQDDFWYPDKLSRAVATLRAEENRDIPLMYCSNVMVADAQLKPVAAMNSSVKNTDFASVLIYNVSTGCTIVFNDCAREEFKKYDMDANMVIMHDRLASLLIALFGKIIYDPEPGMLYRQHGNNVCGEQSLGKVKSFVKRVKRFFGPSNSIRSARARMLLALYGDRLDDEKKRKLYELGYYKTDKKARKNLLKWDIEGNNSLFRWAIRLKVI